MKPINGSVLVFMEILACSCPRSPKPRPNHGHMTARHSGRPGHGACGGDPALCPVQWRGAGSQRQVHTPAASGSSACPQPDTSRCVLHSGPGRSGWRGHLPILQRWRLRHLRATQGGRDRGLTWLIPHATSQLPVGGQSENQDSEGADGPPSWAGGRGLRRAGEDHETRERPVPGSHGDQAGPASSGS